MKVLRARAYGRLLLLLQGGDLSTVDRNVERYRTDLPRTARYYR